MRETERNYEDKNVCRQLRLLNIKALNEDICYNCKLNNTKLNFTTEQHVRWTYCMCAHNVCGKDGLYSSKDLMMVPTTSSQDWRNVYLFQWYAPQPKTREMMLTASKLIYSKHLRKAHQEIQQTFLWPAFFFTSASIILTIHYLYWAHCRCRSNTNTSEMLTSPLGMWLSHWEIWTKGDFVPPYRAVMSCCYYGNGYSAKLL